MATKKLRMLLLFGLSFITMGALLNVNAVDSITCILGLTCSPNPISDVGNITLNLANTTTRGGIITGNCSAGSAVVGWDANAAPLCNPFGSGISKIFQGTGIVLSPNPIQTGSGNFVYLANASTTTIGGIISGNCSTNNYFNGFNSTAGVICTAEVGDISGVTAGNGLTGGGTSGAITLYLQNATPTVLGGIQTGNCSAGNYVNAFNSTAGVQCTNGSTPLYSLNAADQYQKTGVFTNVNNTGISLATNTVYRFSCLLMFNSSAVAVGLSVQLTGPATPTLLGYGINIAENGSQIITNTTDSIKSIAANTYSVNVSGKNVAATGTFYPAFINGIVSNGGTAGTLQPQFAPSATGAVTIQDGSYCEAQLI